MLKVHVSCAILIAFVCISLVSCDDWFDDSDLFPEVSDNQIAFTHGILKLEQYFS